MRDIGLDYFWVRCNKTTKEKMNGLVGTEGHRESSDDHRGDRTFLVKVERRKKN